MIMHWLTDTYIYTYTKSCVVLKNVQVPVIMYFTFVNPLLQNLSTYKFGVENLPTKGSDLPITPHLLLIGTNFGNGDVSPISTTGSTVAASTKWFADTLIRCQAISGLKSSNLVRISLGVLVSSRSDIFSYDRPKISTLFALNSARTGALAVTVRGVNMGYVSYTPGTSMLNTANEASRWISDSSATCRVSGGDIWGTGPPAIAGSYSWGTKRQSNSFFHV